MKAVVAEGVTKVYRLGSGRTLGSDAPREIRALDDVSFAVDAGSALGIIGPNGAGKTTLLKVLARMTPLTAGRIRGSGRVASVLTTSAGFVSDRTGRQNVYTYAAMNGIAGDLVASRLDEIVAFAEIEDFIDIAVSKYSSGMQMRLAFATAIELDPDVLLADEVLAVGDLAFQERCLQRILAAGEQGVAFLFVSHDMNAVRRICDQVLWLDGGKRLDFGPTEEVVARYEETALAGSDRRLRRQDKRNRHTPWGLISGVKLRSTDGDPREAASDTEPFALEVAFNVHEAGISARCAVDLSAHGVLAFRSAQPEAVLIEQAGRYRASVQIPAYLLAPTVYTVSASVELRRQGEVNTCVAAEALRFSVHAEPAAPTAVAEPAVLPGPGTGVVAPRLEWSFWRRKDGHRDDA